MGLKNTEHAKQEKINAIVYGSAGSGKTHLLGTLNEPVLIFDFERGVQSLRNKKITYFDMTEDFDGNYVKDVDRHALLLKALHSLKTGKLLEKDVKWIAIDSLTELAENIIKFERVEERKRAERTNENINGFNVWGNYIEKVIDLIKGLRDMSKYNIIITALATKHKDDSTGIESLTAALQGNVKDRIPAIYDQVLYLHREENDERFLMSKSTHGFICKDRSGTLDPKEPADLSVLVKKIRGAK